MKIFTTIMNLLKTKMPSWLLATFTIIIAVVAFAFVLLNGGETEQKITAPNGAEYVISFELNEGILDLIDGCKLKEVDQSCEIKIGVKATLVTLPSEKEVVEIEASKTPAKEETATEETPAEESKEEKVESPKEETTTK